MKIHPDDPRLSAYLLGELPSDQTAAFQRAVAADPALRAALHDLADLHRTLAATLVTPPATLTPDQRESIRAAARLAPAPAVRRLADTRSWQRRVLPLAAAALVVLAAGIRLFTNDSDTPAPTHPVPIAQVPHPDLPAAQPPTRPLPAPGPARAQYPPALAQTATAGQILTAADHTRLDLPVQAGQASLGWIRQAVRDHHRLPPHADVRIEEILNAFALRPNGPTVVARHPANPWHPDDRGFGTTTHAATLATETLPCPWFPSASLVLISFRANPHSDCHLKAVFHANPASVLRFRLLGFSYPDSPTTTTLPTLLPAKASILLAIQIEPTAAASEAGGLGSIEWSVNGQAAASLPIARPLDAEPSDDAHFAALLCTFAQWLTGQAADVIDADLLAALTRECAATATTLTADRADLIRLINQALQL